MSISKSLLIYIDPQDCVVCPICFAQFVCQYKVIKRIEEDYPPIIINERCNGCAICITECPADAIRLRPLRTNLKGIAPPHR